MMIIMKMCRKMFDLKTAKHSSLFSKFDHIVTGCDSRIKQVGDDDDGDDYDGYVGYDDFGDDYDDDDDDNGDDDNDSGDAG